MIDLLADKQCDLLMDPVHGKVHQTGRYLGDRAIYTCSQGWEIIGAERGCGEPGSIIQIAGWVVGPGITHGNGRGNLLGPNGYDIAFNLGLSPNPLFVFATDRKSFQLAVRAVAD